jgi:SAM-dependent methyltransferase
MEERIGLLDREHLWGAAQRGDETVLTVGLSRVGVRTLNMLQESGAKILLVLGCGQDADTRLFAKEGFCVETIDFSSVGLDQTGRTTKAEHSARCGGVLAQNIRAKLPKYGSAVDAIYSKLFLCMDLQEEEIGEIMWECLQVLKPSGLMVFSVFSDHHPDCGKTTRCGEDEWRVDQGFVAHFFTEDKIRRMTRGFDLLWIRGYDENNPPASGNMYEVVLMKPKG